MNIVVLLIAACLSMQASAEIYRWTDKQGKTHFTDKKPKTTAEDITASVKKQNIDTSTQERQKLESIFRKENEADREFKQQQAQPTQEQVQRCEKAKHYLKTIDGRVQFVDGKGKIINVSEEERKVRVTEARNYIQRNCKN